MLHFFMAHSVYLDKKLLVFEFLCGSDFTRGHCESTMYIVCVCVHIMSSVSMMVSSVLCNMCVCVV